MSLAELQIEEEEVDDLAEASEVIPFTYSITSYGADYPVDGLVQRLRSGDIVVPIFGFASEDQETDAVAFQREYVWSKLQADRFIESLLLGLPVPGIFLVKEADNRLLVLDGHQRLKTLQNFYDGLFRAKEFRLENVQKRFEGLTYKLLEAEDRRRIDNSIIHATVMRQDEPNEEAESSIYLIFERLNSGGTILQPQEIRLALYHGKLAQLLAELNENPTWRTLYGKKSVRQKDVELIERFFAFYYYGDKYSRPMKGFLNRYMATNRHLQKQTEEELRSLFERTTNEILKEIGPRAFKPKSAVNAAVLDSVMVGVASRLTKGAAEGAKSVVDAYRALIADTKYQEAIVRATADEESVQRRLRLAREAFMSAG